MTTATNGLLRRPGAIAERMTAPEQTPYFYALQGDRYSRQELIREYEELTDRSLVVLIGQLDNEVIPPFVDAIGDIDRAGPLDLMLASPGGDAESALRIAKLCHAGRTDFRVVVPDQAKSAATMLALGAEAIVMSDTSDLGPVDAQIWMGSRREYVPTKDVVDVVGDLETRVKGNPEAFPFYSALLGDVDAVAYQRAVAASSRTNELVVEFLRCRASPPDEVKAREVATLLQGPAAHGAVVDFSKAIALGLPAIYIDPSAHEWQLLWRLYSRYHVSLGRNPIALIIEGRRVSLIREYQ
ncbi:MAG: SDH family Clp fold serine proteinase [Acidimicrobiia bacterium]